MTITNIRIIFYYVKFFEFSYGILCLYDCLFLDFFYLTYQSFIRIFEYGKECFNDAITIA
jgi:hypothetical protein